MHKKLTSNQIQENINAFLHVSSTMASLWRKEAQSFCKKQLKHFDDLNRPFVMVSLLKEAKFAVHFLILQIAVGTLHSRSSF
jgi:hypothetical protein